MGEREIILRGISTARETVRSNFEGLPVAVPCIIERVRLGGGGGEQLSTRFVVERVRSGGEEALGPHCVFCRMHGAVCVDDHREEMPCQQMAR